MTSSPRSLRKAFSACQFNRLVSRGPRLECVPAPRHCHRENQARHFPLPCRFSYPDLQNLRSSVAKLETPYHTSIRWRSFRLLEEPALPGKSVSSSPATMELLSAFGSARHSTASQTMHLCAPFRSGPSIFPAPASCESTTFPRQGRRKNPPKTGSVLASWLRSQGCGRHIGVPLLPNEPNGR
ncbi:hypothetical protein VUR80DRAFT_9498 [Thermomyces stellatus]